MARLAGLGVALLLTGCISSRPDNLRRDAMLHSFFTPAAARELRAVPLYYGELEGFCGLAVGDDIGSRTASVMLGFGNRRQVVLGHNCDDLTLFHEYVHQAQYAGLIDTSFFLERLAFLAKDELYRDIPSRWEASIMRQYAQGPAILALLYGRGVTREMVAYMIEGWAAGLYDLPDYFLEVYSDSVRLERPPQRR